MWWLRGGGGDFGELKDGYTPAHYAAIQIAYGDSTGEKLKLIVAACPACIDVQDNDGDTPLHNAAVNGDEKCIEVLISAGCNPLITNKGGKTAYDVAIERDYTASARMIKIQYVSTPVAVQAHCHPHILLHTEPHPCPNARTSHPLAPAHTDQV